MERRIAEMFVVANAEPGGPSAAGYMICGSPPSQRPHIRRCDGVCGGGHQAQEYLIDITPTIQFCLMDNAQAAGV